MSARHQAVTLVDQHMSGDSRAVLERLRESVDLWAATALHDHILDVRQGVESESGDALEALLTAVGNSLTALDAAIRPLLLPSPVHEAAPLVDREVRNLRSQVDSIASRCQSIRAEHAQRSAPEGEHADARAETIAADHRIIGETHEPFSSGPKEALS